MYEYAVECYDRINDLRLLVDILNEYALNGWEFIHSSIDPESVETLYFKRFKDVLPTMPKAFAASYPAIPAMAQN